MVKQIGLLLVLGMISTITWAAPAPAENLVFKPTFLTGYDSLTGGTGFVAKSGPHFVFVTAHHLFGPACGLEKDLTPSEAKEFAAGLAAMSMQDSRIILTSARMLLLGKAQAFVDRDAGHDVTAFLLDDYKGPALTVSGTAPKSGDKVYLLGRPRGEEKLRLIEAVVTKSESNWLQYLYSEAAINFAGTSGAPVLNETGEVVGINLGGGEIEGRTFGFANPASSFAPQIAEAIRLELSATAVKQVVP